MPIAALLPAIIGAAGSIGASAISRKGSSSSTGGVAASTPLLPAGLDTNALVQAIAKQSAAGDSLVASGKDMTSQGNSAIVGPLHFYQQLLGGDRTALMELLAPEIATINEQFRAPLTEAGLTGRAGSLIPDMQAQRQGAISQLFFNQRPQAADKITGIAQSLMSLGTQQQTSGADILGRGAGQILDYNSIIRGIQARGAQDNSSLWGDLGRSLGPTIGQILQGVFDKQGGGGTNPTPPIIYLPTPNPTVPEPDLPPPTIRF